MTRASAGRGCRVAAGRTSSFDCYLSVAHLYGDWVCRSPSASAESFAARPGHLLPLFRASSENPSGSSGFLWDRRGGRLELLLHDSSSSSRFWRRVQGDLRRKISSEGTRLSQGPFEPRAVLQNTLENTDSSFGFTVNNFFFLMNASDS